MKPTLPCSQGLCEHCWEDWHLAQHWVPEGKQGESKEEGKKEEKEKKKRQVACIGTSEAARVQEATHQGELPRRMILEVRTGTGFGKENRE